MSTFYTFSGLSSFSVLAFGTPTYVHGLNLQYKLFVLEGVLC